MCADVYTVGVQLDSSGLQRGVQQSRTLLQQIIQQESQLEKQSQQTNRALQTQARELSTAAARLRDQARAAREARDVKLADSLNAQARALSAQAREARASAAATRDQARASREAATAAKAHQTGMGGGLGGAARGMLGGGLGGGLQGAVGGLAGGVAVSGIMMAAGALKSLMDNATSTATEMLNLHNRLSATAGSAAAGAQAFREVSGLANRLGVDIVDLAGQYASFSAAIKGTTLEGARGRVAFEQISAGLARMGLSSEATQRALSALQQMISKGTVAAEELRGQWGEAVPGGLQIAARAMGVTTTELGKLSEQGKITGTTLVENLGKQMAQETGPTLERVGSGAARLGNVLKELSATLLGPVVRASDKAQGSLATFLAGVFKTSSAMDTLRQKYTEWAGATAEQSKLVTDQQIADLERGTSAYQTEYEKRQQIVRGFHKALADAEEEARLRVTEGIAMGGGGAGGKMPFESDINVARASTEAAQKAAEGIARFDKLSTELEKAKGQLKAFEKAYEEMTEQLTAKPLLATQEAFMAQRTTLEQSITTLRANVSAMEDKAEADKKAEAAARSLADREVDLQLRYQAKHIALTESVEAGEAYEDRTNSMTEAERRAEAQHLRRSSAINAENRSLERAAKATKEWQDILKDLEERYAKAEMGEERYLEKTLQRAGAPAGKVADALRLRRGIEEEEEQTALQRQTRQEYKSTMRELGEQTLIAQRALEQNLSLEEARKRVQMELIAGGDTELAQLQEKYAVAEMTLALYRAQAGLGTEGLSAADAIQSFRDRGLTQGLVETFSPMDAAMDTLTAATSRWDKSLQTTIETLQVQMPEAVETFTTLVEDKFGTIAAIAGDLTGTILSGLEELTEKGATSFREFADSIIKDLLRVLQQQILAPQMQKWIELGIGAGLKLLGAFGGGGTAGGAALAGSGVLAGGVDLGLGADFGAIVPRAVGGPLRSGLSLVGEAGPEAIVSRGGRSMVFPSSHPISRMAVRAHLPGRQFGGPLPSALMGGTGSEAPSQPAASGPGQVAPVIVNVYAQDATSFLKSKGEVQRQMMAAFRSAQRS